jgi:DNA-binding NtrC family response regulator
MKPEGSPTPFTILLVDDEQDVLFSYSIMFRSAGFSHVLTVADSREALSLIQQQTVDLTVLDLQMPYLGGYELLTLIREQHPMIPVIIVTAANELEMAVACMKLGAVDYFVKPVEKGRLVASARRALEARELRNELTSLKNHLLDGVLLSEGAFASSITCSSRMQRIFQYLDAVSHSSQPVLIRGATGTGKELLARSVHTASGRTGSFVAVNVAGLDDQMFADTLFGHLRGAFTGADQKREGLIAKAAGGTLFLDEIGDLEPASQVKLLRLLQEGEYFALGSDTPRRSDVRIVAATHRDLNRLQQSGAFRADLYFRLCTHHVALPTLAERREDIPLLLSHLLNEAAHSMGKDTPTPPPELVRYLASYAFPGNIRELRSIVYDAVARHHRGVLSMESFIEAMGGAPAIPPVVDDENSIILRFPDGRIPTLKEAEETLIAQALAIAGGNQGVAARYLGVTRQAINKKLNRLKE